MLRLQIKNVHDNVQYMCFWPDISTGKIWTRVNAVMNDVIIW